MPTIKEIIKSLDAIHYTNYSYKEKKIKILPTKLNSTQNKVLEKLNLCLPSKLYAK